MDPHTVELSIQGMLSLWDFNDPDETSHRFEQFILRVNQLSGQHELIQITKTQIARTLGLNRKFPEGFDVIREIQQANPHPSDELTVRLALEHGRLLNSSGQRTESSDDFAKAWNIARKAKLDGLAVDAAHMLGIVEDGLAGMDWNEKALELSLTSDQPGANRWQGSLLNNMGWSYHEAGNYERAMQLFEKALELRIAEGKAEPIRVARWSVARCFRSLGKLDVALSIQRSLEVDPQADGYVHEEIGECLYTQGLIEDSKPYFLKAYEQLSQDKWLVANEPARLERLKQLAQ